MDGGVGEVVRDAIGKAGIVPMKKIWDNGFRQITSSSSRQLNSVEDLKGFKIRVPVTALLTSLFSGLGALPSSISVSELYSALQTHIVEGQENPLAQISTNKFYEVQKYCALSNHCWSGYWIVANRRALANLPADLLEIVNSQFDAAAIKERADLLAMDRLLQADLTAKGMIFNTPDPVQFRAALVKAGFYTQWQKTYGAEAWATLEKYTGSLTWRARSDIRADGLRRPYEQQRAEGGGDGRRQQRIAHGIGAVVVFQRVIDHADGERADALAEAGCGQKHDGGSQRAHAGPGRRSARWRRSARDESRPGTRSARVQRPWW